MLILGYAVAVATFIGFVITPANVIAYGFLFAMSGLFIAAEDTLESALAGEMVDEESRALGFGALATMNGVGDLVSSVMIGFIWTFVGYSAGFIVAAFIGAAGTLLLIWTTRDQHNTVRSDR
jgi:MFS family permease